MTNKRKKPKRKQVSKRKAPPRKRRTNVPLVLEAREFAALRQEIEDLKAVIRNMSKEINRLHGLASNDHFENEF